MIVVNDGSYDNTGDVLDELRRSTCRTCAWSRTRRIAGYGGALRSGLAKRRRRSSSSTPTATGSTTSASCRGCWRSSAPRPGWSTATNWSGTIRCTASGSARLYNFCARLLFRIRIRDIDCDYRLIRRALLDEINLTSTSGTICVELVRKLEMSGLRGEGNRGPSLSATARKVAVFPRAVAGEDVLPIGAAVGAAGGAALRRPGRRVRKSRDRVGVLNRAGQARGGLHGQREGLRRDAAVEAFGQDGVVRGVFGQDLEAVIGRRINALQRGRGADRFGVLHPVAKQGLLPDVSDPTLA